MKFAINYSAAAEQLLCDDKIRVDRFKCPAWPDLIGSIKQYPLYVHFPLRAGAGIRDAINTETNQPADWAALEALLAQTDTPFVNLHLKPTPQDYPQLPVDTTDPDHIDMLTERLIVDVESVVKRFGSERVIVENDIDDVGLTLIPAILPHVINQVVKETGCGFLLDASHARIAAGFINMDIETYLMALPLDRTTEIHITGIQRLTQAWAARWQDVKGGPELIHRYAGREIDHLPMTAKDWTFFDGLVAQIRQGNCNQPWIITSEYGGVGPIWEAVTDTAVLAEQAPRLYQLVQTII